MEEIFWHLSCELPVKKTLCFFEIQFWEYLEYKGNWQVLIDLNKEPSKISTTFFNLLRTISSSPSRGIFLGVRRIDFRLFD